MTQSLNEIEALAKRAARGAGMHWGLAEEAGKATRWLHAFDLPGCTHLASYLGKPRGLPPSSIGKVWRNDGELCPIFTGACLSDCSDRLLSYEGLTLISVTHPLLILPFVASAAATVERPISIGWARTNGTDLEMTHVPGIAPIDLTCAPCDAVTNARSPKTRANADFRAFEILQTIAARTYAPATEASRILGAGAGNSDND